MCVCVCVRACVRACVCVCARVCHRGTFASTFVCVKGVFVRFHAHALVFQCSYFFVFYLHGDQAVESSAHTLRAVPRHSGVRLRVLVGELLARAYHRQIELNSIL